MSSPRQSLVPLFFTVFLDLLGIGLAVPVFALLFLDPSHGFLSASASQAQRTVLLGLFVAAYPMAQFFGAPWLGSLSDRHGRKRLLVASVIGQTAGYALLGTAIALQSISLLFGARLLGGLTGGNISIAQSAIADVSDEASRSRNFGLIGMAFGLGFIFGPFLGGRLSDPNLVAWFDFTTPFLFATILSTLNILLLLVWFRETLPEGRPARPGRGPLAGLRDIRRALEMRGTRSMFVVVFLLAFGFNFFMQFFQVLLVQEFAFDQAQIGTLFGYIGVWVAITQGVFNRRLSRLASPGRIVAVAPFLLALSLFALLLPGRSGWLYAVIPFVAIFQGLTTPNALALVSGLCDARGQGQILGLNQSFNALAMAIPPLIAGFVAALNPHLPILLAGVIVMAGWLVFVLNRVRETPSASVCDSP